MIQGPSGTGSTPYTGIDPQRTDAATKLAQVKLDSALPPGPEDKLSKEMPIALTDQPAAPAAFANPAATIERIAASPLSDIDTVTVIFYAFQQLKEIASKDRQMAADDQVAAALASAEKLMSAAEERKSAAVSAAVGAMVGSVVSLLGNSLALHVATMGGAEAENFNTAISRIFQSASEALSGISSSGGKLAAAQQEYSADTYTAASKVIDALAAAHEKRYQEDNDFRSNAAQALNAVIDYVKTVAQSKVDAEKSIARNM